jgi:hypothetical protein
MALVFPLLSSTLIMRMKLPSQLSITDRLLLRKPLPSRLLAVSAPALKSNKPPAVVFALPTNASVTNPTV